MRINKIKNTFFFRFRTNYRSIAPQFRDITRRHGRDIRQYGQRYLRTDAGISPDRTLKKQKIDKQWKDTYQTVFM